MQIHSKSKAHRQNNFTKQHKIKQRITLKIIDLMTYHYR